MHTTENIVLFETACIATARHALTILRLARRKTSSANVIAILASAPHNQAEAVSQEHRHHSFCRDCLDVAFEWIADVGTEWEEIAYHEAERHFLVVIPSLSPGMRTLLEGGFAGVVYGLGIPEHNPLV